MTLVAILSVDPSRLADFRAYEREAARIMARHGGAIERVIVVSPDAPGAPLREVHVVTFPDPARFEAYRRDPELVSLAAERERAVLDTQVLIGEDAPPY